MVTAEDILEQLSAAHTLTPDSEERGSAPAERWLVDGGPATVGIIASVTRSFCGACDRTRLTADGQIRNCLFAREESDLRTAMRDGRHRRGAGRPLADRHARASCPGTASTTRASCSRPGRCRRSAASHAAPVASVTVRYFAGARAAAGVDTETRSAGTLDELVGQIVDAHGEKLERVLTGLLVPRRRDLDPGPRARRCHRDAWSTSCRRLPADELREDGAMSILEQGEGQGGGAARPRRAGLRGVARRRRGHRRRRGPHLEAEAEEEAPRRRRERRGRRTGRRRTRRFPLTTICG